jgi:hypothetical protein
MRRDFDCSGKWMSAALYRGKMDEGYALSWQNKLKVTRTINAKETKMNKPTKFITGMLAMALVFGMMAIGCDTGGGGGGSAPDSVIGTWEGPEPGQSGYTLRMTFTATTVKQDRLLNGNVVQTYFSNVPYTYSGGTVTMTVPGSASQGGGTYIVTVRGNTGTVDVGGVPYTFTKVTSSTPTPDNSTSLAGTVWEVALPASATGGQSGYKMRLTFAATTVTRAVIYPDGNSDSEAVPYTLSGNTITVEGDVWTISGNTISVPNDGTGGGTIIFTKKS